RRMTVLLRCYLTFGYLWLLLQSAALAPALETKPKSAMLSLKREYTLVYSSSLHFDMDTQGYVFTAILLVMVRLYQCCRCNFWSASKRAFYEGDELRVGFNRRLFVHFGPYLLLFIICWIASVHFMWVNVVEVWTNEALELPKQLYFKFALTVLFKLLVLSNAITRCLRAYLLLRLFANEPDEMHNPHDFGEHLNLFFHN
ncbi:hypothetical protein KR222_000561, partial [Zaprionus bogoriensis]